MIAELSDGEEMVLPAQRFIDRDTGEDVTDFMLYEFNGTQQRPRFKVVQTFSGESMTQQEFFDSTDVNKIYARCMREGLSMVDIAGMGPGQFGDVSELQGNDLTTLIEKARRVGQVVTDYVDSYAPPVAEDPQASPAASGSVPEVPSS